MKLKKSMFYNSMFYKSMFYKSMFYKSIFINPCFTHPVHVLQIHVLQIIFYKSMFYKSSQVEFYNMPVFIAQDFVIPFENVKFCIVFSVDLSLNLHNALFRI